MKHLRKTAVLLLLCTAYSAALASDGLSLYSYRDSQGKLIVVGSIEAVPLEYRSSVEYGFIQPFQETNKKNAESKTVKGRAQPAENRYRAPIASFSAHSNAQALSKPSIKAPSTNEITIIEAPKEQETKLAEAEDAMIKFRRIVQNYGLIVTAASINGIKHPHVTQYHLTAGKLIESVKLPAKMSTKAGTSWKEEAAGFILSCKRAQNITLHWITQNQQALLLRELPILQNALKLSLQKLEALAAETEG